MMKGSQDASQSVTPTTNMYYRPNNGGRGVGSAQANMSPLLYFMSQHFPQHLRQFGSGTKGSTQPQAQTPFTNPNPVATPAPTPVLTPEQNIQQMPAYSSQPVAPSAAITSFMGANYASGGNVKADGADSIEDDIKAALRLARLIGELTKKE